MTSSDQPPNCDLAVRNNHKDAFTITLNNRLKLLDDKTSVKLHEDTFLDDDSITNVYMINSPAQEIDSNDDYLLQYNHISTLNEIDLILDQKDYTPVNENSGLKHANEFDELIEFECAEEITPGDLFIREVIEDVMLRAFALIDDDTRPTDDDNDADEDGDCCQVPRVRRCSSLKSGKTPPGTPSCKKIVRFADVMGLDLADVRTYLDEIPKVPLSAYKDLSNCDMSEHMHHVCQSQTPMTNMRTLLTLFQQPVSHPNFIGTVTLRMVALENAFVDDPVSFCIKGIVRVRNLDYNKSVHVRYTMDSWKTSNDIQAVYVNGSSDGFTDKFAFTLYAYALEIGERLEFAVRFQCRGEQYWDNNNGSNYCFQCLPASTPQPLTIPSDLNELATFCYSH